MAVMERRVEPVSFCVQAGYETLALVTQDFCSILEPLFGIDGPGVTEQGTVNWG